MALGLRPSFILYDKLATPALGPPVALSCHQRNRSGVQVAASRTSEPRPPTPPFPRPAPQAGGPRRLSFGKAAEAVVETDKAACKLALSLQQSSQQYSKFQAQVNCERLQHPSSSGLLLLLQNSSKLSRFKNTPPMFFGKSRKCIRCTFRSTPAPCKIWVSTSPTEFFKSVQNTPPPIFLKETGRVFTGHFERLHHLSSPGLLLLLSLQHRTCRFEAGPPAQIQLHS